MKNYWRRFLLVSLPSSLVCLLVLASPSQSVGEPSGAAAARPGARANRSTLARSSATDPSDIPFNGNDNGKDVLLQGFHWTSKNYNADKKTWYGYLESLAPDIRADFTAVWLPPPSSSADGQGYMPSDWANLDTPYGSAKALRSLIGAFHDGQPSVKAIADIVINHRAAKAKCGKGVWDQYDYASFGMGGPDFMDHSVDWIGDNLKGDNDHMLSGANEGAWSHNGRTYSNEDFGGSSDINHWNYATRNTIKAWLKWLKDPANAGFDGWRFDMIGGYDPGFLGEYNYESQPYLSVGEKPTGERQMLSDMVNRSGNQTMVFDFPMRDSLGRALGDINHVYGDQLGQAGKENSENGLIGWWSNVAMTLVNNHDIQPDHQTVGRAVFPWGVPGSTAGVTTQAAYAYILTHPGIPSVFIYDWRDRGPGLTNAIDNLIKIRQANNVTRQSRVYVDKAEDGVYAAYVGAKNGEQLAIKIGKSGSGNYENWVPNASLGLKETFTKFEPSGHAYCVFYKNKVALKQ
jgi:alpha-amylase